MLPLDFPYHVDANSASVTHDGTKVDTVDKNGATPLLGALYLGKLEAAKILLKHGANPDFRAKGGFTGLMLAAMTGNVKATQVLLDGKADVNAETDQGQTALLLASVKGETEVVKLLLARGADINGVDVNGATPLIRADAKRTLESRHVSWARPGSKPSRYKNDRSNAAVWAIAFRAVGTPLGAALLDKSGSSLHIAGRLRADEWRGEVRVQLHLEDAALAS